MRMSMRRFTRLTNAFSKKIDNHIHMLSLYFLHYNFCRINQYYRRETFGALKNVDPPLRRER